MTPGKLWGGLVVLFCAGKLRFSHQPEVEQALTQGMTEIKTKLSAKQLEELDELYAKLQRRWQVSRDYLQTTQERLKLMK
ncbi:MAG: hypothetical protein E6K66_10000 [Nitrospirae bacterium]|nr:MAG: hypothetical protein E6K66_10000 [Nitrospirota bacterium]